jgi:hypothetical protein
MPSPIPNESWVGRTIMDRIPEQWLGGELTPLIFNLITRVQGEACK